MFCLLYVVVMTNVLLAIGCINYEHYVSRIVMVVVVVLCCWGYYRIVMVVVGVDADRSLTN